MASPLWRAWNVENTCTWRNPLPEAAKMRFTNSPEANKYLVPNFRKGWGMA